MNNLNLMIPESKLAIAPEPDEILLLLGSKEGPLIRVGVGDTVKTGQKLADGVISPVTGRIERFETVRRISGDEKALRITNSKEEELDLSLESLEKYTAMNPGQILEKLRRANIDFADPDGETEYIIIGGVDTEPLSGINQLLLEEKKAELGEGLKLLFHLFSPKKIILAVPEGLSESVQDLKGNGIDILSVDPSYPNGLPPILARNLAVKYRSDRFYYQGIERLVAAVEYIISGKPYTHKLLTLTVNNRTANIKVRIGTLLSEIVKHDHPGKVIINGPMAGYAALNLATPVTEKFNSVIIQEPAEVIPNSNHQCINCGRCVSACPVDLDINLIGRYAEFSLFEKALALGGSECFECGLCAYACPAGRSLVQLVRLAKHEASKINSEGVQ